MNRQLLVVIQLMQSRRPILVHPKAHFCNIKDKSNLTGLKQILARFRFEPTMPTAFYYVLTSEIFYGKNLAVFDGIQRYCNTLAQPYGTLRSFICQEPRVIDCEKTQHDVCYLYQKIYKRIKKKYINTDYLHGTV